MGIERLYARKEEKKVNDKEWMFTWMMIETKKEKRDREFPVTRVKRCSEKRWRRSVK